ncbi:hypothetical protein KAR91_81755 [Candidatus Pacearchaeota archaeon]|nr:hypothetical protein [Candidatus Pacearchaeota archaeon]
MKALLKINVPLSNVSIIGRIKKSDIEKNYDCVVYIPANIVPYLQNVFFDIQVIMQEDKYL